MTRFRKLLSSIAPLAASLLGSGVPSAAQTAALPGARVEVFARVPAAREMAVCGGTLFIGTTRDAVYGVPLSGGRAVRAASGLAAPN
jgi:hypothetical protein